MTMVHKFGVPAELPAEQPERGTLDDFRKATGAILRRVEEANRSIEQNRPWELAKTGRQGPVLAELLRTCRLLGEELEPFVPELAARVRRQCTVVDGSLPAPKPLVPRLAFEPRHSPVQRK